MSAIKKSIVFVILASTAVMISCGVDLGKKIGQNTEFEPYPQKELSSSWLGMTLVSNEECWMYFDASPDTYYYIWTDNNPGVLSKIDFFGEDKSQQLQPSSFQDLLRYKQIHAIKSDSAQRIWIRAAAYSETNVGLNSFKMQAYPFIQGSIRIKKGEYHTGSFKFDKTEWFCFDAESGRKYRIQWQGSSSKGDSYVLVSAFHADKSTPYFSNIEKSIYGQIVTAAETGPVYLKVVPSSYNYNLDGYTIMASEVKTGDRDMPIILTPDTWTDGSFTDMSEVWYSFSSTPNGTYTLYCQSFTGTEGKDSEFFFSKYGDKFEYTFYNNSIPISFDISTAGTPISAYSGDAGKKIILCVHKLFTDKKSENGTTFSLKIK